MKLESRRGHLNPTKSESRRGTPIAKSESIRREVDAPRPFEPDEVGVAPRHPDREIGIGSP